MTHRPELPRHGFDLTLIKPASNGVEVNFHSNHLATETQRLGEIKKLRALVAPWHKLRLHHYEIIEEHIHTGLRERASQHADIPGGKVCIGCRGNFFKIDIER